MWVSTRFCVYAAHPQASILPGTAMISLLSNPSPSNLNMPFHQRMSLAQELGLFRDDGANLAVCKAPLPSNLAKHNSNGKKAFSDLNPRSKASWKSLGQQPPTLVTCHCNRTKGPQSVLGAILQVRFSLHLS